MSRNKVEKERYICHNHEPDSLIFDHRPTNRKPVPVCPICNDDEYMSGYQGDRLPNKKEVLINEKVRIINNGKIHPATKTKRDSE